MPPEGPQAPDVDAAFDAALRGDAAAPPPADIPLPPPVSASDDPAAPHGYDEAGKPLAPYGLVKGTDRPRLKPAGPGRGGKADRPRVTAAAVAVRPAGPGKAAPAAAADYTEDLAGLATAVWLGGASFRATRPYAQLWHESSPGMVAAWNQAAQQNPAVRARVEQLAGDGSWAWVFAVAATTGPFLAGCMQLMKTPKDPQAKAELAAAKAALAAQCEADLHAYMAQAVSAAAAQAAA